MFPIVELTIIFIGEWEDGKGVGREKNNKNNNNNYICEPRLYFINKK
jgi:hypothetical protein